MPAESAAITLRQLGPYGLLAKLGSGGMGTVYLALQRGIGGFEKRVALKCINREAADDKKFVAMLVDEARLMAQLTHPNIVQVIDLAEQDGLHYVVMEYVEGIDARTLASSFDLAIDEAVHIVAEAARGLAYAHRKCGPDGAPLGIVHRDISGHNLLVSVEGITKVLDFGIAKAASNRHRTEIGVLKGKIAYMSPEQAMGKALDARSDLFSLGIVLWELCTGRRLFLGDTEIQLLMKVQRCEFEPPSRVVDGFPRQLEDIILKCLAANPDDRYANGERLADDLMEFQRTHVGAVAPRVRLAEKVARYLQDHPPAKLDDAAGPASLEKTVAAATVDHTVALTRALTAQPAPVRNARRRLIAASGLFLASAVAMASWFVLPRAATKESEPVAASLPSPEAPTALKQKTPKSKARPSSPAEPSAKQQMQTAAIPLPKAEASVRPSEEKSAIHAEKAAQPPPKQVQPIAKERTPSTPSAAPVPAPVPAPAPSVPPVAKVALPPDAKPMHAPDAEDVPAAASALLSLNASPWARVYIDGVSVAASTPLIKHELPAGKHKVVLVNPELRVRREFEIEIQPGEHHRKTVPLQ